jgi:YHS domain-containing protein
MSDYNWCHNPDCHKIETQSRVRGSGDNKVLRTVKIKVYQPETPHIYDFFCNQNCLHQFLRKFCREVANIRPVKQPSETPIKVKITKSQDYRMRYNGNDYEKIPYTSTSMTIESINNE